MKLLRHALSLITFFILGLVLSGCEATYTASPLGATPLKMPRSDWSGDWLVEVGETKGGGEPAKRVCHVRITDEENGKGVVGFVDFKGSKFEVQHFNFSALQTTPAKGDPVLFINIALGDSTSSLPLLVQKKGAETFLHFVNPKLVRMLSQAGKLPALPDPPRSDEPGKAANPSVKADEAFTAALQKFFQEQGAGEFLAFTRKDGSTFRMKRLTTEK